jgi:DNA repair exonuclease SbcCD ATPase subunit
MTESRNLWNEDELLSQLEEAQDQIDQLQNRVDGLMDVINKKNEQLTKLRWENSSEISKLQSVLQQAQNKIQEQRDQIVKLNGADLILKDNEKLKSENDRLANENVKLVNKNAKLVSENDRIIKEAAHAEDAAKSKYQKRTLAAREAEMAAHRKEKEADDLIRGNDYVINTIVSSKEKEIKEKAKKYYLDLMHSYEEKWAAGNKVLTHKLILTGLYAMTITGLWIIQFIAGVL